MFGQQPPVSFRAVCLPFHDTRASTCSPSMLSPNTSFRDLSLVTSLTQCQLDYVTQHVEYTQSQNQDDP